MSQDLPLFLVFAAGLLSFLSPCVLPLIPSYLSILGGVGFGNSPSVKPGNKLERNRLVFAATGFVLGFSTVFISFGILISTTFFLMSAAAAYINWVAGIIVIILGLNVIFDFLSFLNYEKRPFFSGLKHRPGLSGGIVTLPSTFIAGAAFGAGWTPCIGPILGGILLLAAQSGQTGVAAFYLAVYSAGLALPFLLAALFFDSFLKYSSKLRSRLPLIRRISGILLIIIGLAILTGQYSALNIVIQRWIFSYIEWAQAQALPFRLLANALTWIHNF